MKKLLLPLLLSLLIVLTPWGSARGTSGPSSPLACTSFAVYSGDPIYGMNFDYPEVPIRLTIQEFGDLGVFQMEFMDEGEFVPTVGMNSAGLLGSSQMLFPEMPSTPAGDGERMTIWQLYQAALYRQNSVADVRSLIEDYRIVNSGLTLHDLFADPTGDALVVEVIGDQEALTPITGSYIVMTNFPVRAIQGQPRDAIEGVGADRYQIVSRIIEENLDAFLVETGLQALQAAVLEGEFSTQASMVFDPLRLVVYIALDRNFDRIWLVSLEESTIATYQGFGMKATLPLDHQGITEQEMLEMGNPLAAGRGFTSDLGLLIAVLALTVLVMWGFRRYVGKTLPGNRGHPDG